MMQIEIRKSTECRTATNMRLQIDGKTIVDVVLIRTRGKSGVAKIGLINLDNKVKVIRNDEEILKCRK